MNRCRAALFGCLVLLMPVVAQAQAVSIDLGAAGQAGATSRLVQITALVTVLSLAPSLLVMLTAFTRIVIVLSLLRSALSTQGTPPNMVLIGLALFLTFFVMQPVLRAILGGGPAADEPGEGGRPGRTAAGRRAVPRIHDAQPPSGGPAAVPGSSASCRPRQRPTRRRGAR